MSVSKEIILTRLAGLAESKSQNEKKIAHLTAEIDILKKRLGIDTS